MGKGAESSGSATLLRLPAVARRESDLCERCDTSVLEHFDLVCPIVDDVKMVVHGGLNHEATERGFTAS
jgi:hypothetical protein